MTITNLVLQVALQGGLKCTFTSTFQKAITQNLHQLEVLVDIFAYTLCLRRQFQQSFLKVREAHVDVTCDAFQVRDQILSILVSFQVPATSLQPEHLGGLGEGEGGVLGMTNLQVQPLVLVAFRNVIILQVVADGLRGGKGPAQLSEFFEVSVPLLVSRDVGYCLGVESFHLQSTLILLPFLYDAVNRSILLGQLEEPLIHGLVRQQVGRLSLDMRRARCLELFAPSHLQLVGDGSHAPLCSQVRDER